MYHQVSPHELEVNSEGCAFDRRRTELAQRHFHSTYETQPKHETAKCFVPSYSTSLQYGKPNVGSFYHDQTQFTSNGGQSFHESVFSAVQIQSAPYPVEGYAPLPVTFLPYNQCSLASSYPPGYEGLSNELNYDDNPNGRNFVAPQYEMVVPDCYNYMNTHKLNQVQMEALGVQHNPCSPNAHIPDRNTEVETSTCRSPEIVLNQQDITAARDSVPNSCTTNYRAPKEVPSIVRVATISPRPSNEPKRHSANVGESLAKCKRRGSFKEKSVDFEECEDENNLANAPIFQMLCELSKA